MIRRAHSQSEKLNLWQLLSFKLNFPTVFLELVYCLEWTIKELNPRNFDLWFLIVIEFEVSGGDCVLRFKIISFEIVVCSLFMSRVPKTFFRIGFRDDLKARNWIGVKFEQISLSRYRRVLKNLFGNSMDLA